MNLRTRSDDDDDGESKAERSDCREESREEVLVPRRRRMRLGFSCGRGARRERARAERAFLGFLGEGNWISFCVDCNGRFKVSGFNW